MNGGHIGLGPAVGSGSLGASTWGCFPHSPFAGKCDWEEVGNLARNHSVTGHFLSTPSPPPAPHRSQDRSGGESAVADVPPLKEEVNRALG